MGRPLLGEVQGRAAVVCSDRQDGHPGARPLGVVTKGQAARQGGLTRFFER
jgi:hypothetical protein